MKYLIALAIFATLATGCRHEPEVVLAPDTPSFSGVCDPDTVYFQHDILPLITSRCASPDCHDADNPEEGVRLTDYANIMNHGEIIPGQPWEGELIEQILESDPDKVMPPPPLSPLTAAEIDLIQTWISQGARNNSCADCDTVNVTFSGSVSGLIANYCEGCHSGANPEGNRALVTYEDIRNSAIDGSLLSSLLGTDGFTLMPYQSSPLLECQIDMIEIWINDGAPNN